MASLVLGVAGSYFGGMIGGPWGARIGFMVGSAIGGAIDGPPAVNGPQLSDLRVTGSGYGKVIPTVYGTMRMAGDVIWSTAKKPTKHSDSQGAKGGQSQTVNTTTYSVSCAVGVCEGPSSGAGIAGITRIWMNGILVYDIRATNLKASGVSENIRVYKGTEVQVPDALIVATQGSAPAYLGLVYVVFEDLQLADYGNQMPNFEFEVVNNGAIATPAADIHGVGGWTSSTSPFSGLMFVGSMDVSTGANPRVEVWDPNFIGRTYINYRPKIIRNVDNVS